MGAHGKLTLGADLQPLGLDSDIARRQLTDSRQRREYVCVTTLLCEPCEEKYKGDGVSCGTVSRWQERLTHSEE